ncbi:MAG: hypothetical protein LBP42_00615, partial [Treponema sp.]|nr:hypothetical protein [Treponema sp.]
MGIMPPDFSGSPRSIPQEGFRQSRQGEIPAETPAPGKQEGKPPLPGKISFPQVSSQDVLPFQSIFKNLAIALGIPQDTLSSQLIAFFRYFSLPLEGEILSKLRR